MKKVIWILIGILILVALIVQGCGSSSPTTAPAPAATNAPASSAPAAAKPAPAPSTSAAPAPAPASSQAASAPIVIKLVSFLPTATPTYKTCVPLLIDAVKTKSNGRLIIQPLGGPEIIAAPSVTEAVARNVIQMGLVTPDNYQGMVPLGSMWGLSQLDPDEELKSGAYDYVNSLHNKAGLWYLARTSYTYKSIQHNMITNKNITKPQQLAGARIGASSPIITPFCKKLGAASVIVPTPDFYTSLERGVVDAIGDPLQNLMSYQLYEVCKYVIEQGYYRSSAIYVVNLDTWNSLPKDLQTAFSAAARDVLYQYMDLVDKQIIPAAFKLATDKGMKIIKFSDEDNAWYVKQAYDGAWEDMARLFPEQSAKLKPLISK
jgi:TRAP-type transport system periplasmic protein